MPGLFEEQKGSQWLRNGMSERATSRTHGARDIMGHLVVIAESLALTQGNWGH